MLVGDSSTWECMAGVGAVLPNCRILPDDRALLKILRIILPGSGFGLCRMPDQTTLKGGHYLFSTTSNL